MTKAQLSVRFRKIKLHRGVYTTWCRLGIRNKSCKMLFFPVSEGSCRLKSSPVYCEGEKDQRWRPDSGSAFSRCSSSCEWHLNQFGGKVDWIESFLLITGKHILVLSWTHHLGHSYGGIQQTPLSRFPLSQADLSQTHVIIIVRRHKYIYNWASCSSPQKEHLGTQTPGW